ncbi:MAG: thiamine pyrophosphate-dependent enzyme [Magnetococcus sp. DMHC-6]
MNKKYTKIYEEATPKWYSADRAREIIQAYNSGAGSSQPADEFLSASLIPAASGSHRDFSYIAPDLPKYIADHCVACMECVQNCPDSAIWGRVIPVQTLENDLANRDAESKNLIESQMAKTTKFWQTYEKKRNKDPQATPPALFSILVDPTKCKGCGECVTACGDHHALEMIRKTKENLPSFLTLWDFYKNIGETSEAYINPRLKVDNMLRESANQFVGGGGSCMGCGETSVIRQLLAATAEHVGQKYGIVAATGCNTVYGSTYPYNPYRVPWTNSLFENAPAVAMGIRAHWDRTGRADQVLWVFGGDGAMLDIGFQALSRMLASGMNIKALVLDTQVYSNTGGQASTATYIGQSAKMSVHGKTIFGKQERRKEIANIAMMHPYTFVAQTIGPMVNHFYKAVEQALEFNGPALINVYTTCQPEHQVADDRSCSQAQLAVESRAFPVFVYHPEGGPTFASRISLQGNPSVNRDWHTRKSKTGEEKIDFISFTRTEGRFKQHFDANGNPSDTILRSMQDRLDNWRLLQELAGIENIDLKLCPGEG